MCIYAFPAASKKLEINLIILNHFESLLKKKIEIIYPILSLFHSKFKSIFSNNYFSIHSNPLSIILYLLQSLFKYKFTSIFSNTSFSITFSPSKSTLIFLYPLLNHNTLLSFSISPFLSHSILHPSRSIFFNLSFSTSSYALSIYVNLFLCLCQSQFTSIFFNLPFSI